MLVRSGLTSNMDNTKEIKDSMKEKRQVLVLGIGNILLRDEGVGPHIISVLKKESLPPFVELLDGGTAGADLLDCICDRKKVIVIDAIDADVEPGTIMCFDGYSIQSQSDYFSLHQCGISETLAMAKHLDSAPEKVLAIGVKPKDISCGIGISEEIKAKVPSIVKTVMSELGIVSQIVGQESYRCKVG